MKRCTLASDLGDGWLWYGALFALVCACSNPKVGAVAAKADPGCSQRWCEREGWCSNVGGVCIATEVTHCALSTACTRDDCCTLSAGDCVCE